MSVSLLSGWLPTTLRATALASVVVDNALAMPETFILPTAKNTFTYRRRGSGTGENNNSR